MSFNNAAWLQYHRGRRLGTIPPPPRGDRTLCPDCGLLMTRRWFIDIHGVAPEDYGRVESPLRTPLDEPDGFVDPTQERWFWQDERAAR